VPDYDFKGLSPRSFEHLVQAIAVAEIGLRVTVFGDGRDGGREATFDGSTSPGSPFEWSGYGVIQAKFRQRPTDDSETDGEWAVEQLRNELADYEKSNPPRRIPEYFIFSTNVILTPYPELGGKDKVRRELGNWANKHGLKGWAVWDFDQLCTYLDVHEGIRRTFAAWTTSGDVLATVLSMLEKITPDFSTIAVQFLQKELRRDLYANLQQAGHLNEEPVPLAQVFIDLPVSDAPMMKPGQEWVSLPRFTQTGWFITQTAAEACVPLVRKAPDDLADSGDYRHRAGRIVLLGGPGQGKTTVGQYLCQLFRVAILNDVDPTLLEPHARDGCKLITEVVTNERGQLPRCKRFPIRVVLSDFAAELSRSEGMSLLQYITKLFNVRTERDLAPSDIYTFLQEYPFILVLDGLDEVPPSSNRNRVVQSISDFEADIAVNHMDAMVLVTTRPQGYSEDLSPRFYRHQVLTPLNSKVALEYGQKLTEIRHAADPDRINRIKGRLQLAASHEATSRLMQSPLQVTIMTFLVDQFGRPPEERWELFHQYYELICRREVERNIDSSRVIREYKANIDNVHRSVGLLLQSKSERSGGTRSRLSLDQFEALTRILLQKEGFAGERLEEVLAAIRAAAAHRLVFLVGLEEGEVRFEIRSFQEFMAGEALLDGSDSLVQSRLEAIAGSSNWRNVFLFAAGKIFKEVLHLRPMIMGICTALNDDPADPARQILMSGSQLALDLLAEGTAKKSPLFAGQLTRLALRLLESRVHKSGRALADVCTQDTVPIYIDELEGYIAHGSDSARKEGWACLTRLADLGFITVEDWNEMFAAHPVLLDDADCFWSAAAAVDTNEAMLTQLASRLLTVDPSEVIKWDRFVSDRLPEVLTRKKLWPQSFDRALHFLLGRPMINVTLRVTDGVSPNFIINSCIPSVHTDSGSLVIDGSSHPSWAVIDAAFSYMTHGTAEYLAALLTCGKDKLGDVFLEHFFTTLPWPAAACLTSAQRNGNVDEIAASLRAGKMGDLEQWIRWEEEWKTAGLTWSSFSGPHDDPLPFVANTWLAAPLMAICGYRGVEWIRTDPWPIVLEVSRIAQDLKDPASRTALLSHAILDPLWGHQARIDESPSIPLSPALLDAVAVLLESEPLMAPAVQRLLTRVDTSGTSDAEERERYVNLVNEAFVLEEKEFCTLKFGDRVVNMFRLAVGRDPNLVGLLTPIASRAADANRPFVPFDIDTHLQRMTKPLAIRDEAAVMVIRARQVGLHESVLPEVVTLVQRFGEDYLSELIGAAGCVMDTVTAERLLVRLHKALRRSDESVRDAALNELSDRLRRRQTHLAQGDEWARLGLPRALLELCR